MLREQCQKCQMKQSKVRCQLCKRGYCESCASFVNGLCTSCLKSQRKGSIKGKQSREGPTFFRS